MIWNYRKSNLSSLPKDIIKMIIDKLKYEKKSIQQLMDDWINIDQEEFLRIIYTLYPQSDKDLLIERLDKWEPFKYPIIRMDDMNDLCFTHEYLGIFGRLNEHLSCNAIRMCEQHCNNTLRLHHRSQQYHLIEGIYFISEIPNKVIVDVGLERVVFEPHRKYLFLGMTSCLSPFVDVEIKFESDIDIKYEVIGWIFKNNERAYSLSFESTFYFEKKKFISTFKNGCPTIRPQ